ncbi:MAG TPA: histidinol dehydrogenase, partial [Casimicrobiaceae bacterium]|nr:histidinol dehydrogenase [Casimicrobiaceae bacterium]
MKIKLIKTSERGFDAALKKIVQRSKGNGAGVDERVASIVRAVREKGDRALFDFTRRFDGVALDRRTVEVSKKEIAAALKSVPARDLRTLRLAARR